MKILVKHEENDYRLHEGDGSETGEKWEDKPDTRSLRVDQADKIIYRDVEEHGGSEVDFDL